MLTRLAIAIIFVPTGASADYAYHINIRTTSLRGEVGSVKFAMSAERLTDIVFSDPDQKCESNPIPLPLRVVISKLTIAGDTGTYLDSNRHGFAWGSFGKGMTESAEPVVTIDNRGDDSYFNQGINYGDSLDFVVSFSGKALSTPNPDNCLGSSFALTLIDAKGKSFTSPLYPGSPIVVLTIDSNGFSDIIIRSPEGETSPLVTVSQIPQQLGQDGRPLCYPSCEQ